MRTELTADDWEDRIAKSLQKDTGDEVVRDVYHILVTLFQRLPKPSGAVWLLRVDGQHRVREPDYFDRYFAFRLPVADVRDSDVLKELRELSHSGAWPPNSVLIECIVDPQRRQLVRRKIMNHLGVIQDAPSRTAEQAAHLLTAALPTGERDLLFGRWSAIVYALLAHAICTAGSTGEAKEVAARFRAEFGLDDTVDVLSQPLELTTIIHELVVQATQVIRDEVFDLCVRDMTTEVVPPEYPTQTILGVSHYLDDELWTKLSDYAQNLLAIGSTTQGDLAARFVSMSHRMDVTTGNLSALPVFSRFEMEEFARLVPKDTWRLDQILMPENDTIDQVDTSLRNRRTFAANVLRQSILEAEPPIDEPD